MKLLIHSTDSAPEASRPLLDGLAADLGLVPNLAATIAESPTLLAAFDGMRRAVGTGALAPVLREVAGLATGVAVDNHYGVAFHSTMLDGLGVAAPEVERMRSGEPPQDDDASAAVYVLAHAVVTGRGKVDDTLVDRATTAGLSAADILEVVAECAFASLVGIVDNLAGQVELDAFLRPRAWSA
jgi:alkylhydroperoxidase family enzyme